VTIYLVECSLLRAVYSRELGLGLGLGFDLVSGWYMVLCTCICATLDCNQPKFHLARHVSIQLDTFDVSSQSSSSCSHAVRQLSST